MTEFFSNGKLLITGEYLVLDGAKALAIPTSFGQSLSIKKIERPRINWKSFTEDDCCWYAEKFQLHENGIPTAFNQEKPEVSARLIEIFSILQKKKPDLFSTGGYEIETKLFFPQDWGLGSSSTLINNLAQWAQVDPYELLAETFGGSGYDLACAQHDKPIIFRLHDGNPEVEEVDFNPSFANKLFFVHLNKKQNSREGIAHYRKQNSALKANAIQHISLLTEKFLESQQLSDFETLLTEHEQILSEVLDLPPVKSNLFSDYPGAIKSLGAWGGDFVLATGDEEAREYFRRKGYYTIVGFKEMLRST